MDRKTIIRIVQQQEAITPARLPAKEYAAMFSPSHWQQATPFLRNPHVKFHRVGTWIWGRVVNYTSLAILSADGRVERRVCTCPYGRSPQGCVHQAALLMAWAERPRAFVVKRAPQPARTPFHIIVSERDFEEGELPVGSPAPFIEVLKRNLIDGYKIQDLRQFLRTLGIPARGTRKDELAASLAKTLVDANLARPLLSDLSTDEFTYLVLNVQFDGTPNRPLESFVPHFARQLYTLFDVPLPPADKSPRWEALHTLYTMLEVPPLALFPWVPEMLSLPVSVEKGPVEATHAHSPLRISRIFHRLLRVVGETGLPVPEIYVPKNIPMKLVLSNAFFWHPEWALLRSTPPYVPVLFHMLNFPSPVIERLAHSLDTSEDMALIWVHLGLVLPLLYTDERKGLLLLNDKAVEKFFTHSHSWRVRILAKRFMEMAAHLAAHRIQVEKATRVVGYVEEMWLSPDPHYIVSPKIGLLFQDMLHLLSLTPRDTWIPWAEVERVLSPWLTEDVARNLYYSVSTDVVAEWEEFLKNWVHQAFLYFGEGGIVDLAVRDGRITHVRHRFLHDLLLAVDLPLEIDESEAVRVSPSDVDAQPYKNTMRVFFPLDAPLKLTTTLSLWADELKPHHGRMRAVLTPESVGNQIARGASVEALARAWEEALGFPLPARLRSYIEQIARGVGAVRLYPQVTLLRFQDENTRRHLEAALPTLRDAIVGMVDERTVIIPAARADEVRYALERSGYMPRWVNLEDRT